MVGSTELSARLDPEDFGDLLHGYQRVCRDAIVRHDGHISQFFGDGVLAYFGYPQAHDDDAVRAVRSALSILETVRLINNGIGRRLHAEVHCRIGLHSGVVAFADTISERRDRLAVGETVNLAARIESVAPVDSVVMSAATAELVQGYFELESTPAQVLKGFARPIELFRVVRATGARTKFEAAARGRLTPHIDREQELNALANAWKEIQQGDTRMILVTGEAGIGKSRIVHQFKQSVLGEATTIIDCLCSPLAQATPLAPITEYLEQRVLDRTDGTRSASTRVAALQRMLAEHSCFGPDALPLMAALLSIPGVDETPISELTPVRRRARTLELMREWLVSSAERVPIALIVEDLQWADPSTLDFLDLLVREGMQGRVMMCVTARPEFHRWKNSQVRQISLARLPTVHIDAMIKHVAADAELSTFLVERIAARSEGVPLYIEEVTKLVVERMRAEPEQASCSPAPALLPSTLRGTVEARLDQIASGRLIAQLGAAIGREFHHALLQAIAQMDEAELQQKLRLLSASELVFIQGDPPDATYRFKHALIQDAVYDTIPKQSRERFHDRIFRALTERFPGLIEKRPEMAAHHAELARRPEIAVHYLLQAGARALGRQAVAEAVLHLRRGLELIAALPEPARAQVELEYQAAIMPAYMATLGWAADEVQHSSERLLELAIQREDADKEFLARWGIWTVPFVRGALRPALVAAQSVYDVAVVRGDPISRITGCHALGYTLYSLGDFKGAKRIAREAFAVSTLAVERQIAARFQLGSGSIIHGFCAASHWLLGEQDQASALTATWHTLVSDLKHPPSTVLSLAFEGYLLHMQREPKKLRALATRLRTISEQEQFQLWIAMSDLFEAWAIAHDGQVDLAVERINTAIATWLTTNSRLTMCDNRVMQAEVFLLAGRAQEALAAIAAGKEVCAIQGERTLEPELYRLEGEALELLGRRDAALEATQEAVRRARELSALSLELRAATQLHRWMASEESLSQLRATYLIFTEGFGNLDLKVARSLLTAAGDTHVEPANRIGRGNPDARDKRS